MSRAYDLDAHVSRVLERERRKFAQPPIGQLPLFDDPSLAIGPTRRNRRYETPEGLVVDDEKLFSRAVCLHSIGKETAARKYAEIVGLSMHDKWELWWIELFAGPGRLYVRETGEYVPGSPLDAMTVPFPFHGYVFADLSRPCVASLRRRVARADANAYVLEGDANGAEIVDRVYATVPTTALVVLYADQEGLDLKWETIKFFVDRYPHLDLLLNLPVEGVVRALSAGYDAKASSLLDHPDPARLIETSGAKGVPVRDWYHRKLAVEGFDQIHSVTIKMHGRNRDLYDLLLASRHPLARKFFEAAAGGSVEAARRLAAGS